MFQFLDRALALYVVATMRLLVRGGFPKLVDVGRDLLRAVSRLVCVRLRPVLLKSCLNLTVQAHVLLENLVIAFYLLLVRVYVLCCVAS